MAVSISQAQAKNMDALDFDGENKDNFRECVTALERLAGKLKDSAATNLIKADKVSTSYLLDHIEVTDKQINGSKVRIDITVPMYAQFIDKGVKGTKGGNGEYSFKNDKVGGKMKNAIRKWLIKEGIAARTIKNEKLKSKTNKLISKREKFRKTIKETSDSTAYAIAKSIKQKGLKKTNFMTKAINETRKLAKEELGNGLKVDIMAMIPKRIN